jgi:thiol-disulfide isomerase/thioredoxin
MSNSYFWLVKLLNPFMKKYGILATFLFMCHFFFAQTGYDIKITLKNCPDSTVYLARYFWDQLPVIDSCKKIRNGQIRFKGPGTLERGVYFIANQQKNKFYFQFIVDADQQFTITSDQNDIVNTQKSDEHQNQEFFSYVKFMTAKNVEMEKIRESTKGKSKEDSARFVNEKSKAMNEEIVKYDAEFMKRNKGTFLYDLMNLKAERYATDIPKASNGRPDSLYQYYYYKNHFWDGVNFKDDRLIYTPFFAGKIKRYFDQIVPQLPDSVIKELDFILKQCVPGTTMYQTLVGHFAHKYETAKTMSFDQAGKCHSFEKVFVHLCDNYILGGKMKGYYSEETEKAIADKINIVRHLLPDARVPDLFAIDTINGPAVKKMGFDTVSSSEAATALYMKNQEQLARMFRTLYGVSAKYTVLVFWAEDCGHCQKEVPKLHDELKVLKGKVDYKVFAVQTKSELFKEWKKFITEKKLTDFIHVFDPVHMNNLKEQFDIDATPVIYLLDKDKRIKGKKLTPEQVVDIIENLETIEKNLNK